MIFNAKIIEQMRLKHISHNLPGRLRLFLDAISNNVYGLFVCLFVFLFCFVLFC